MSARGRYCCKSPKLPGDKFPATRRTNRRPPIYVGSITLPRSPVSLSSGDEAPHISTRKSRLQPGEFLITSAKRLLQHNRHRADIPKRQSVVRFWRQTGKHSLVLSLTAFEPKRSAYRPWSHRPRDGSVV